MLHSRWKRDVEVLGFAPAQDMTWYARYGKCEKPPQKPLPTLKLMVVGWATVRVRWEPNEEPEIRICACVLPAGAAELHFADDDEDTGREFIDIIHETEMQP